MENIYFAIIESTVVAISIRRRFDDGYLFLSSFSSYYSFSAISKWLWTSNQMRSLDESLQEKLVDKDVIPWFIAIDRNLNWVVIIKCRNGLNGRKVILFHLILSHYTWTPTISHFCRLNWNFPSCEFIIHPEVFLQSTRYNL